MWRNRTLITPPCVTGSTATLGGDLSNSGLVDLKILLQLQPMPFLSRPDHKLEICFPCNGPGIGEE